MRVLVAPFINDGIITDEINKVGSGHVRINKTRPASFDKTQGASRNSRTRTPVAVGYLFRILEKRSGTLFPARSSPNK